MARLERFSLQLEALAQAGRRRRLVEQTGKDFSSNDYLGLARSDFLREAAHDALDSGIAHGSGGSRLLGGNHPEHEKLEAFAAGHYGAEAALFFQSGYTANLALFSTLPQSGDIVFYDELIHASAHDGMKIGRATVRSFRHNDCNDLESQIGQYRQGGGRGTIWIAFESLYSMDGDQAPFEQMQKIADRHDAMLIIDEAHAVGVFGQNGIGLSGKLGAQDNVLILRTCGKALGVEGGLITMAAVFRDFFINRARPFIFSTAPSPLTAHLVHIAIQHIADTPSLPKQLHDNIIFAEGLLGDLCLPERSGSQLFPIILGDDKIAVDAAHAIQEHGLDVRAIRPPTVPAGTARLRLSLTLNVTQQDISELAQLCHDIMKLARAA